ncbi:PIN domain-containing protein [Sulfuricella sp.]|uniref:type II toxin-antitoxin system VapC family toxin n=1 Tax=Sulfuricella sp. TaxID=2099377 RepID=UPI002CB15BF6|nr:PIN domain-containing protein [Sulfuricella sp.]HUX63283.1 PIN domain-containing protein [Sulfuricella sp.]
MSASVLLDTSFLISLVSENRPHHATATQYYRHLLTNNVPMYFSAIVAAEFSIKQPITDLPLGNFRILEFNVPHGKEAAKLWNALGQRGAEDNRAVVRDDVKLLAQASHEDIDLILTEDASTLHKYCERLRSSGHLQTRAITLKNGFDAGALSEGGQTDWVGGPATDPDS